MAIPRKPANAGNTPNQASGSARASGGYPAAPQRPERPSRMPQSPARPQYVNIDPDELEPERTFHQEDDYVLIDDIDEEPEYVAPRPSPQPSVQTPTARQPQREAAVVEEDIDEEDAEAIADQYENWTEEDVLAARALLDLLNSDKSSELLLNGPTSILYKSNGVRVHAKHIQFSSVQAYHQFIDDIILEHTDTADRINAKEGVNYLIEGQLTLPNWEDEDTPPLLARVHVVAPPVVPEAKVTIAKKSRYQLTLDNIISNGSLSPIMGEFLKAVARGRVTTVFSGLSGSGKTTLLEALSHHFDPNDRIIVVEDTPELRFPITDVVYLHSTSPKPGFDQSKVVSLEWLVSSTNRMRPDRIVVGEVRGGEMSEFLIAANSGADGSLTTMHASNPKLTLDKMVSLAMKSSSSKSELSVARDIASTVQIIVQMSLIEGQHIVTQIEEVTRVVRKETGGIVTQTLFEYNRDTRKFQASNRPSADLMSYFSQRGIELDMGWFR